MSSQSQKYVQQERCVWEKESPPFRIMHRRRFYENSKMEESLYLEAMIQGKWRTSNTNIVSDEMVIDVLFEAIGDLVKRYQEEIN